MEWRKLVRGETGGELGSERKRFVFRFYKKNHINTFILIGKVFLKLSKYKSLLKMTGWKNIQGKTAV